MNRRTVLTILGVIGVLAFIGFALGFSSALSEGLSNALWGGIILAIGLPFGMLFSFAVFAFPLWVFVKLGRHFGFAPLIGAILMFTPLLPLGVLLLFHSKRKGEAPSS